MGDGDLTCRVPAPIQRHPGYGTAHQPNVEEEDAHHISPRARFDRWLLMAEANHQMWVDTRYKAPFFELFNEYQTARPGQFPLQASLGNVHLPTSVFVHCLIEVGCDTIRLKAYGQKMPLTHQFLHKEPAEVDHRWAERNEWDIGTSFLSPYIWLFASTTGRRRGLTHYRMMVPGSGDYGTVNIKTEHEGRKYTVKVYPRRVHLMKLLNSRLQACVPKSLQGVRVQIAAGQRMIHNLTGEDQHAIGGFRIEVTVKASSLKAATKLMKMTGFLEPEYWLGVGDGPHAGHSLTAKLVTRAGLLANANWVYQQAAAARMFRGRAALKPTKIQIQALTDVLNAVGWNAGLRKATKSSDPEAWWVVEPDNPTGPARIFHDLSTMYQTSDQIRDLFHLARANCNSHSLPCRVQPLNEAHRYQVHGRSPIQGAVCQAGM